MRTQKLTDQFQHVIDLATQLAEVVSADALMILLEGSTDWQQLRKAVGKRRVLLAADLASELEGAADAGFPVVVLNMADSPVQEKLTQALLESVADDILAPGARVVAIYCGFEADTIDSISIIHLGEHLGRLTSRDLRQFETKVPLDTLKVVVDLALDIGREGREGKPVGTLFVVGDTRKVVACSHPVGFDPVRGYSRKERNLFDPKVREGIKEIAQMDGAFVVNPDGTVEAAARYIDASAETITLLQRARRPALGGGGGDAQDQSGGSGGERIERDGANFPQRRGDLADRAVPPGDEVEGFRIRTAAGGIILRFDAASRRYTHSRQQAIMDATNSMSKINV